MNTHFGKLPSKYLSEAWQFESGPGDIRYPGKFEGRQSSLLSLLTCSKATGWQWGLWKIEPQAPGSWWPQQHEDWSTQSPAESHPPSDSPDRKDNSPRFEDGYQTQFLPGEGSKEGAPIIRVLSVFFAATMKALGCHEEPVLRVAMEYLELLFKGEVNKQKERVTQGLLLCTLGSLTAPTNSPAFSQNPVTVDPCLWVTACSPLCGAEGEQD